jgi:hypothetical protein
MISIAIIFCAGWQEVRGRTMMLCACLSNMTLSVQYRTAYHTSRVTKLARMSNRNGIFALDESFEGDTCLLHSGGT